MASRDPIDLRADVRTAWLKCLTDYAAAFPDDPQPFLTCTYRSPVEQDMLYAIGRTRPGKRVTNARGGQSNHNQKPCRAFDIAFRQAGKIMWDIRLFKQFAVIAKQNGLLWGGDWQGFKDKPHFEGKKL